MFYYFLEDATLRVKCSNGRENALIGVFANHKKGEFGLSRVVFIFSISKQKKKVIEVLKAQK